MVEDQSDSSFIIRNAPINTAPSVRIVTPNGGETLSGIVTIEWIGSDLEDDLLSFDVFVLKNGEVTSIGVGLTESDLSWDTTEFIDGTRYSIGVNASDGDFFVIDYSDQFFTIQNQHSESSSIISINRSQSDTLESPKLPAQVNLFLPTLGLLSCILLSFHRRKNP